MYILTVISRFQCFHFMSIYLSCSIYVGYSEDKLLFTFAQPSSQQHQTLIIEEFEPDVFRQLIEYIHTGCVTLQPRTLLGKDFEMYCWNICITRGKMLNLMTVLLVASTSCLLILSPTFLFSCTVSGISWWIVKDFQNMLKELFTICFVIFSYDSQRT